MGGRAGSGVQTIALLVALATGSACAKGPAASIASAKLSIYRLEADVRAHGQAPFLIGRDQQPLALDDTVRTDPKGFAEIDYPDGSLTRLDANTTFTVTRLVDAQGKRAVSARLDLGRSWNRVEKISGSGGFSITTPNAVASVQGTVFVVACDPEPRCQFIDFEGSISVHTTLGTVVTVGPGQEVDVGPDGSASAVTSFTAADTWFVENQAIDQGSPPPGPSSSQSAASSPLGPADLATIDPCALVSKAAIEQAVGGTVSEPKRQDGPTTLACVATVGATKTDFYLLSVGRKPSQKADFEAAVSQLAKDNSQTPSPAGGIGDEALWFMTTVYGPHEVDFHVLDRTAHIVVVVSLSGKSTQQLEIIAESLARTAVGNL